VGEVVMAAVNKTTTAQNEATNSSSKISKAVMDIITILAIAVVAMGILLSVITIQNRPSSRVARMEARDLAAAQRVSAQEAYRSDLQRPVEHRELTQAELDRISGL
jgi:hypothetical protein